MAPHQNTTPHDTPHPTGAPAERAGAGCRGPKPYKHTPANQRILEALLLGQPYQQAASNAGVSLSTVKRRMTEPGFQRRLAEMIEEGNKQFKRRLTPSATAALNVLMSVAGDRNGEARKAGATNRVTAARAVLDAHIRLQIRADQADNPDATPATLLRVILPGVDVEAIR